ncbi:MAG: hypothetical protein EA424_10575 [Planctomycetaceae bacterium]|nr:MAG: hypothetical protein EA424_10575 [Planctomycetaceae bacterium]
MYRFVLTGNAGSDSLHIEILHLRRHPLMRFEASALAGSFARFRAGRSFLEVARDPETEIMTWSDDWLNGAPVKVAKFSTTFSVAAGGQPTPVVNTVFLDAELGHCLQVIYEDDHGRQKDVFEYADEVDGIPVVTRVLGFDEIEGQWALRREERFREIRFGQAVDEAIFTLSYYGFPEPVIDRSPSPRRWFLALAAGAALLALGWAIRSIAKSSQFAESKPKEQQGT